MTLFFITSSFSSAFFEKVNIDLIKFAFREFFEVLEGYNCGRIVRFVVLHMEQYYQ